MKKLSLILSFILLSQNAAATDAVDFVCSLTLGQGENQVLIVKDRPVRLTATNDMSQAQLINAFEDLNEIIQKKTMVRALFLMNAYWVKEGSSARPELSLGLYRHNKFKVSEPVKYSTAAGDARTEVRLTTKSPGLDLDIEFSCRNKNYLEI